MKPIDIEGKRFNRLVVVKRVEHSSRHSIRLGITYMSAYHKVNKGQLLRA